MGNEVENKTTLLENYIDLEIYSVTISFYASIKKG
jgi:hypothetical protein